METRKLTNRESQGCPLTHGIPTRLTEEGPWKVCHITWSNGATLGQPHPPSWGNLPGCPLRPLEGGRGFKRSCPAGGKPCL